MGRAQEDDLPLDDPLKQEAQISCYCPCCCRVDEGIRHQRLATVATSRLVSLKVLLGIRVTLLLLLTFGAIWLGWKSSGGDSIDEEPPLFSCWPEWSYIVSILYFLMAIVACLRQSKVRPFTPRSSVTGSVESVRRSFVNTATQILLEISVVFETIAVPVTWIESAKGGKEDGRALVHLVALGSVVTDLLLNRARVEAKHAWVLLAFLLAWAMEQIAWVKSKPSHAACYEVFDAKDPSSLWTGVIAVILVVAVVVVYAVLCTQRDRLTSQYERSDVEFTGPDVEEDAGQEATETVGMPLPLPLPPPLPTSFRPPPARRASVVNPIFAGSGSRIKQKWHKSSGDPIGPTCDNRTSLTSNDSDMSPAEDLEARWSADAEPPSENSYVNSTNGPSLALASTANGARGRRVEWGATGGGPLVAHPSTQAAYSGAAAWVRPSNSDATPTARGQRGVLRRPPSRSLSTSSNSRWPG